MSTKINIHTFLQKFNEEYAYLYKHEEKVAGFDDAVQAFDDLLAKSPKFISEFAQFRGDPITSDREAAAFMFTLSSMITEENA